MGYLLDTNVWITYLRGRNLNLRHKIVEEVKTDNIKLCSIVKAELNLRRIQKH